MISPLSCGARIVIERQIAKTRSQSKDYFCHSERREDLPLKPPRFLAKRRSVQNDMNFHSLLTATSHDTKRRPLRSPSSADAIFPCRIIFYPGRTQVEAPPFPSLRPRLVEGNQVGIHGADALGQGVFGGKQRALGDEDVQKIRFTGKIKLRSEIYGLAVFTTATDRDLRVSCCLA